MADIATAQRPFADATPTVVMAQAELLADCLEFVRDVAILAKDGEKLDDDGEPWTMENDEAWETVHSLIGEARAILFMPDPEQH